MKKSVLNFAFFGLLLSACGSISNKPVPPTTNRPHGYNDNLKSYVENLKFENHDRFNTDVMTIKSLYRKAGTDLVNSRKNQNGSIKKALFLEEVNEIDEELPFEMEVEDVNFEEDLIKSKLDLSEHYINLFNYMNGLSKDEFSFYCGSFAPITIDEHECFAKIQINEITHELNYIVQMGHGFYLYSAFYGKLGENFSYERHLEKEEGDSLYVDLNYIGYSMENDKISYPMRNILVNFNDETGNSDVYEDKLLNKESDLKEMDIINSYSMLKYPFMNFATSSLNKALLLAETETVENMEAFVTLSENFLSNSLIIGKYDNNSDRVSCSLPHGHVEDNKLYLDTPELKVKVTNKTLFTLEDCKLFYTWRRNAVRFNDKGRNYHSIDYALDVDAVIEIDEEYVTITLPEYLDLNDSYITQSSNDYISYQESFVEEGRRVDTTKDTYFLERYFDDVFYNDIPGFYYGFERNEENFKVLEFDNIYKA